MKTKVKEMSYPESRHLMEFLGLKKPEFIERVWSKGKYTEQKYKIVLKDHGWQPYKYKLLKNEIWD